MKFTLQCPTCDEIFELVIDPNNFADLAVRVRGCPRCGEPYAGGPSDGTFAMFPVRVFIEDKE